MTIAKKGASPISIKLKKGSKDLISSRDGVFDYAGSCPVICV